MRLSNKEPKVDANMIVGIETSCTNLSREMSAIMDRLALQVEELEKVLKEQSSRQLSSEKMNDDIQKSEKVTLSLENELLSPTLDEDNVLMKCDKMPLVLKGEFQDLSLVEKNEYTIEEESSLKEMQVEKKHLEFIIENVLVRVEDFNFPIDCLTFGMEKDQQVSFKEKPSFATSQVCIDVEHGETTFLVGEEKVKFDLHQSILLMNEKMRACMKIESSFSTIKEDAPMFL